MKTRVLFLAVIILFGVLLFSNGIIRDLPINELDKMVETNDAKSTGDSLNCTLTGRALFGECSNVFIIDTIAYSCHGVSLLIFNIKDAVNPILLGFYDANGAVYGVYVIDTLAYIANGYGGLRIINVSNPDNMVEIGFYNTGNFARRVCVVDTIAYVADGNTGLRIINVSNPVNPIEIGFYDTGGWTYNVSVIDTIAYVAETCQECCV